MDLHGYKRFPVDTIEVEDLKTSSQFLSGLDYMGDLEGWKVFKKIGRAFKKVGKAVKKLTIKKVLKVGVPVAGAFLAPLAIAKGAILAKKFGSGIAKMVKSGNTKPQLIDLASGAKAVGLVSPEEAARFQEFVHDPLQAVPEALFNRVTGQSAGARVAPGAQVEGDMITLPTYNQDAEVETTVRPIGEAAAAGSKTALYVGGAVALLVLSKMFGGRKS